MTGKLDPRSRLGVDIGGTFTDTVAYTADGRLRIGKTLTTPRREGDGVLASLANSGASLDEAALLVHGTTIVINALLERRGVHSAIVVTEGFRDIIAMGRGNRPEIYNPYYERDAAFIPDEMRFEIRERMSAAGEVLQVPSEADIDALIEELRGKDPQAVAVAFLHSYRNDSHERLVAEKIAAALPGVFVTTSASLSRQWREYERFTTASANAYVGPLVGNYASRLVGRLQEAGFEGDFLFMDATGGAIGRSTAEKFPIRLVESGPVGGVIAAAHIARELDLRNVVTLDIGGTTAKASLIESGAYETLGVYWINGYARGLPLQVPVVDIEEVGAGGGSLGWLDNGRLRVGPRSAGAEPGPAAYGKGGKQPTVTDALVHCGHFHPGIFIAEFELDAEAATRAVEGLAQQCNLSTNRMALGILELACETMAGVVRRQTLERGLDPASFTMIVSGGAGPGQACRVADAVGIRQVLVPPHPGHFSAFGMLKSDLRFTRQTLVETPLRELTRHDIQSRIDALSDELDREIAQDSRFAGNAQTSATISLRYAGQEHSLRIPLRPALLEDGADLYEGVIDDFSTYYSRRFGYVDEVSAIEVIDIEVIVQRDLPSIGIAPGGTDLDQGTLQVSCLFDAETGFVDTSAMVREALKPGVRYAGPMLVYEIGAISVVPPRWTAECSDRGYLILTREN